MIRFLTDENFSAKILEGMRRRNAEADAVRVQDVGLAGAGDPEVLEWAAEQGRVVLTHDVRTMTRFAIERIQAGLQMPGVIEVPRRMAIGQAIEDLTLIAGASLDGEYVDRVVHLPLS